MNTRAIVLRVIAWVAWIVFVLFSVGAWIFALAMRSDKYFISHYQHFSMDKLTLIMTSHPVWLAVLPFLWLPWVIAYHRRANPLFGTLISQAVTMMAASLGTAVLLLLSGPPIQM